MFISLLGNHISILARSMLTVSFVIESAMGCRVVHRDDDVLILFVPILDCVGLARTVCSVPIYGTRKRSTKENELTQMKSYKSSNQTYRMKVGSSL